MTKTKSLVLVTVDCLRADHTGFMGYSRPTTPFLDQLSSESFVVPNAIVTGAPTYYSFPGIMASRCPLGLGREVIGIAPDEPTLAIVLRDAGYATAAIIAANPYLSTRFGYERGFEVFLDHLSSDRAPGGSKHRTGLATKWNGVVGGIANKLGAGRAYHELYFQYCQRVAASRNESWYSLRRFPGADTIVDEATAWLAALGERPFFLWLHFMDPHAPYYPSEKSLRAIGAGEMQPSRGRYLNESWNRSDIRSGRLSGYRDEILQLYDAGIRWVDTQLERLVKELKLLRAWDSCVFAVTADHGEEFLDHNGRFHSPSNGYQEMLRVPFLLRVPGVHGRRTSNGPFSLLHLAPTVLDAMGLERPSSFEGRSYWQDMQKGLSPEMAISESAAGCTNPMRAEKRLGARLLVVQDQRYKLIVDCEHRTEELFDLKFDAEEKNPLPLGEGHEARKRLFTVALAHLDRARHQQKAFALGAKVRQIGLELNHSEVQPELTAT